MFCKKCGSQLNEGDAFCAKCGAKVNEEIKKEEYDPLVALDKGESIEEDVIWQEAPIDEESIIIKNTGIEPKAEPVMGEIDDSLQVVEKKESNFKENVSQGIRAAKATIANPIKPRKRSKPTIPKPSITPEEVIIPETKTENIQETIPQETVQTTQQVVTETVQEEPVVTEAVQEAPVVEETVVEEPVVTETVTEEVPTDAVVANDEVVDIFDDFIVDDSFTLEDESPVITPDHVEEPAAEPVVEQVPEPVVEQVPEPVVEQVAEPVPEPVPEPVAEPVAEPVPEPVAEPVVEQAPIIEEAPTQKIVPQEVTPKQATFEEIPEPVIKQEPTIQTPKPEPIIPTIQKPETKPEPQPQTVPKAVTPTKTEPEQIDLEELVNEDNDTPIINSIKESRNQNQVIKKKTTKPQVEVNEADEEIKSKFNTKLDDELIDESFDVDENINSITSRITTILIIILILIIAVVVATFLLQNIGL
ncbi:MAG: zinc-ribbon domain-containing protein [Methanosphaera sp.]|nr:zinc-ribbon domain-containing protein [Methanosphaera sp.]